MMVFFTYLYLIKNIDKPLEELLRLIVRFMSLIRELGRGGGVD
ncbi:MAG: hypothetical protein N2Z40_05730 [Caldimicrobium sp.]|nr:hypothetical protein [Caldimicrobium sp.]MCX7613700.1 hypothetical protein [Caldimicrobium sp.]MDW8183152.1 hypothetical protein [Caldimicrobium sp.]